MEYVYFMTFIFMAVVVSNILGELIVKYLEKPPKIEVHIHVDGEMISEGVIKGTLDSQKFIEDVYNKVKNLGKGVING